MTLTETLTGNATIFGKSVALPSLSKSETVPDLLGEVIDIADSMYGASHEASGQLEIDFSNSTIVAKITGSATIKDKQYPFSHDVLDLSGNYEILSKILAFTSSNGSSVVVGGFTGVLTVAAA